jgi:hypothetical protein
MNGLVVQLCGCEKLRRVSEAVLGQYMQLVTLELTSRG